MTDPAPRERGPVLLSVVTPVFNEVAIVDELVLRIAEACAQVGCPFEIVVVNDGSTDGTLGKLVAASRARAELRVLDLSRNFGHMPALDAGVRAARGDVIVVLDGDLQDPPELIPAMVSKWREGLDVVYGLRTARRESLPRRIANVAFYRLLSFLADNAIPEQVGTFGLMDRWVADALAAMPERHRFFAGLRAWVGGATGSVEYERPDRRDERSRVGLKGLVHLARTALISFSKVPLRAAAAVSALAGFVLFAVGAAAIVVRLVTDLAIPGWATSTTMIGMMGFVQSLALAMIAEYVAVIFDEIKGRPLGLVRHEFQGGDRIAVASPAVIPAVSPEADRPGPG